MSVDMAVKELKDSVEAFTAELKGTMGQQALLQNQAAAQALEVEKQRMISAQAYETACQTESGKEFEALTNFRTSALALGSQAAKAQLDFFAKSLLIFERIAVAQETQAKAVTTGKTK